MRTSTSATPRLRSSISASACSPSAARPTTSNPCRVEDLRDRRRASRDGRRRRRRSFGSVMLAGWRCRAQTSFVNATVLSRTSAGPPSSASSSRSPAGRARRARGGRRATTSRIPSSACIGLVGSPARGCGARRQTTRRACGCCSETALEMKATLRALLDFARQRRGRAARRSRRRAVRAAIGARPPRHADAARGRRALPGRAGLVPCAGRRARPGGPPPARSPRAEAARLVGVEVAGGSAPRLAGSARLARRARRGADRRRPRRAARARRRRLSSGCPPSEPSPSP